MATTAANQLAPVDHALQDVRKMLAVNAKGLTALLGSYMPPERYCGAILTLCRQNTDLLDNQKASRGSLLLSVMRIAQLQLSPDPALGQAWIVPRKGKAEMQLGWKGCLALAYRHPLMGAVRYGVVGKNDRFVWQDGRNWRLEHDPSPEGWPETLNDIVAAWCILDLRTGFSIPRVIYLPEILRHKGRGQGSQPAWTTDPAAMALKTVIADACRRGPFEGEISRGFQLDHLGEVGKGQPDDGTIDADFSVENGDGEPPKGNLAKFKSAHRKQDPAAAPPTPDSPESQGEGGSSASGPEGNPPSPEPSGVPAESSGPVIHSQGGDAGDDTPQESTCGDSPEVSPEPPGPVQVAEDLREPALLPAVKVEGLYKLADRYKVPRFSLESYAAEKFGSGNLESLPATFEGDLMKWIAAEGGRLKKEARR